MFKLFIITTIELHMVGHSFRKKREVMKFREGLLYAQFTPSLVFAQFDKTIKARIRIQLVFKNIFFKVEKREEQSTPVIV